jgi:hypothetical protein
MFSVVVPNKSIGICPMHSLIKVLKEKRNETPARNLLHAACMVVPSISAAIPRTVHVVLTNKHVVQHYMPIAQCMS